MVSGEFHVTILAALSGVSPGILALLSQCLFLVVSAGGVRYGPGTADHARLSPDSCQNFRRAGGGCPGGAPAAQRGRTTLTPVAGAVTLWRRGKPDNASHRGFDCHRPGGGARSPRAVRASQ